MILGLLRLLGIVTLVWGEAALLHLALGRGPEER